MKTIICTPMARASYSGYWCFVPSPQREPGDHTAVVEDAELGPDDRVEEERPEAADDEPDGQERERPAPLRTSSSTGVPARRRSRRAARSRRCSRGAPTPAGHPRSCSAATRTACAGWRAGTARTPPSRREPRSTRTRSPRCTRGGADAGDGDESSGRRRVRRTRTRRRRRSRSLPSAAASARSFIPRPHPLEDDVLLGRSGAPCRRRGAISPKSVPSMMSAPTSATPRSRRLRWWTLS